MENNSSSLPPARARPVRPGAARRILFYLGVLVVFIGAFYLEEDLRGRAAWENCRLGFSARRRVLEWDAFIPPPLKDDQNIFKAPKMQEWFVGRGQNEFGKRLAAGQPKTEEMTIAELEIQPPPADWAGIPGAGLALRQLSPGMAVFTIDSNSLSNQAETISFDDLPLTEAIRQLAKFQEIKVRFDESVLQSFGTHEPAVQQRWKNLNARQAMMALLNGSGLQLVDDPKTGEARVMRKEASDPKAYFSPGALEEMAQRLRGDMGPMAVGATGTVFLRSSEQVKPARIVFYSENAPDAKEIEGIFSACFPAKAGYLGDALRVETVGGISFRVRLKPVCSATDYLAATDPFAPELDQIRQAVKRPGARMDGDYHFPVGVPIPNFVTCRTVAQMLSQRAQCHLLLGQPDQALAEVMLTSDLCRLLECKSTTLVAAMVNVAIRGLYVSAVAEGLRLKMWREPDLSALQGQLQKINLLPYLSAALNYEPAAMCRVFETIGSGYEFAKMMGETKHWWRDPAILLYVTMPRGWVFQNMTTVATLEEGAMDSINPRRGVIFPRRAGTASAEVSAALAQFSPYTFLARIAVPNFTRSLQTCARNQTQANQAGVACALERYRLARGQYPATLEDLAPSFLEKIPHDVIGGKPLKYRRTEDGQFVLYSTGWDEADHGGVPGKTYWGEGDWVWNDLR
jgi:hypothetical protein